MAKDLIEDLQSLAERLKAAAAEGERPEVSGPLDELRGVAINVGDAWSGSPIGYHARVYYADFAKPPADAHWSSEWGAQEAFSNPTQGAWHLQAYDAVVEEIHRRAGNPDLTETESAAKRVKEVFREAQPEIVSILTAFVSERPDELIDSLKARAEEIKVASADEYARAALPSGEFMSRDMKAMTEGLRVAPHLVVIAEVLGLRSPFASCAELGDVAIQAATHLRRIGDARQAVASVQGEAAFIGHGRSLLWRELKDFVQDRLELPWEEFNRVPVAGVTNIARLAEMLDSSGIAFLILTAEDERVDGAVIARQNVVHEAGLFQGRLGFTRAIVVLEEGCEPFSNIEGLGQIRFPVGQISAAFEEVRRVLEREGFLTS